ncbi:MAG TPA: IclR family transcriptional regulator C-terminal domain-containing protein, partial [Sphingomicrobium sp.]
LSLQNNLYIQYFIIKLPAHRFKASPLEGNMRLMTDSTSGLALLSRMSDRQVDKICRNVNYYESEAGDRVDIAAVLKELAWVRHVGYCSRDDAPAPGISSLAFPLDETLYGIPLALGVGGMTDRLQNAKSEIVKAVRATIAEFNAEWRDQPEFQNTTIEATAGESFGDRRAAA